MLPQKWLVFQLKRLVEASKKLLFKNKLCNLNFIPLSFFATIILNSTPSTRRMLRMSSM